MKKIFLYIGAVSLLVSSCKRDRTISPPVEVDIAVQNTLDDQAIAYFMENNYLDDSGVVRQFDNNDPSDDHYKKLSELQPQKLSNGTYYIIRQQALGMNPIHHNSVIRLMGRTMTYKANETKQGGRFGGDLIFRSGLDSGEIEVDPNYFFTPQNIIDSYNTKNSTSYGKSFFEIEGFSEALVNFKAFDKNDDEDYQLQGVIIVPSRAAFAREAHYNYSGYSLRDRSFVFNFQVYKSSDRQ